MIIPLSLLGAAALVGLLAYVNARQRREEIGLLLALGLRTEPDHDVVSRQGGTAGTDRRRARRRAGVVGRDERQRRRGSRSDDVGADVILPVAADDRRDDSAGRCGVAAIASWAAALFAARQDAALVLQGD